jgi:hypothetical protein
MARLPFDNTFGESAERVRALFDKIGASAESLGVPEGDARMVNPCNCLRAVSAAEGSLRLMEWSRTGGAGTLIAGLSLVPPDGLVRFSADLLRATKHFMLLEYQFQIEALFSNVLRALGQEVPSGFYKVVVQLHQFLSMTEPARRRERLYLAAHMRNSMHANGVHSGHQGRDTIVLVGDLEFRFEHGKRVSCGHWEHACVAISTSFDEVLDVLNAEQVRDLDFVPELYTQLLAQDAS